ncbi:hypothetical protein GIB67_043238 [Kingdonia uniflora]|uniref:Uncharacterized protein n=1 Tax=Kingdonia uniflora TaxID=39325 RepID=A0A7J7L2N7_9MAGN|nr:hypothetical protein GIB67_043238 [Kingdonia uniflora]
MTSWLHDGFLLKISAYSGKFILEKLNEMAARSHPLRKDQASIRYWGAPLHVVSSDLSDIDQEQDVSTQSGYPKKSTKSSEPRPHEILKFADFQILVIPACLSSHGKRKASKLHESCTMWAKIYGWLNEKPYLGLEYPVNLAQVELKKLDHNRTKCKVRPSDKTVESVGHHLSLDKTLESVEHVLRPRTDSEATIVPSNIASVCSDYHIDHLGNNAYGKSQSVQEDDKVPDSRQRKVTDLLLEDKPKT